MTKTEVEQSNGVALKLVNKSNGDFLLTKYKDTSDTAVAVFSEQTRETVFFTYDESGELSNEVFTISFLASTEEVVDSNMGPALVDHSTATLGGHIPAAIVSDTPVVTGDATVPEQPPIDNAHVAPGAEQFPEPTTPVVPMADEPSPVEDATESVATDIAQ